MTLVALTAGAFVPLHLLATLNLLLGLPAITAHAVILASLTGISISVWLLCRTGMIDGPEAIDYLQEDRVSGWAKAAFALTLVPFAVLLLNSFCSFPDGYDPIAYHLNVALKWLQSGTMRVNPAWGWQYSLPSNAELPALAILSVGMQKAVAIGNLFAAMLLASSLYLIAWRLTRQTEPATLAVVVGMSIPMVIYQTFQLYVDLFGTAFLVAAIALLIWREKNPRLCSFLSGYAVGIAIGCKPVFWVYGAIFTVAALAINLRKAKSDLKPAILLLVGGILLSSGFWFIRSAAATGNPVYPMRVSIGNIELLRGYARTDITSNDYGIQSLRDVVTQPWTELTHDNGLPVGADRGTGPLLAAIAVPGVFFLFVQAIRRRASALEVSLLLATSAGFVLWTLTLLRVPRFALPIIMLSCALAAPMVQTVLTQRRNLPAILCLLGVLLNSFFCLAEPAERILSRFRRHDWSRATYYGYPAMIDQLPRGSRILDLTQAHRFSFVLAGAGLTNYVVPEGALQSAKRGDYVATDDPSNPDDAALRSAGATLIYDATPPNLYPKVARSWRIYRIP